MPKLRSPCGMGCGATAKSSRVASAAGAHASVAQSAASPRTTTGAPAKMYGSRPPSARSEKSSDAMPQSSSPGAWSAAMSAAVRPQASRASANSGARTARTARTAPRAAATWSAVRFSGAGDARPASDARAPSATSACAGASPRFRRRSAVPPGGRRHSPSAPNSSSTSPAPSLPSRTQRKPLWPAGKGPSVPAFATSTWSTTSGCAARRPSAASR
mmetsp:Transcript_18334/g.63604  ORF Transcript_18334/g.63604 Transcript_18334/m.63604 type:complete len:216 (+) Transcript_18334:713-1360(+)